MESWWRVLFNHDYPFAKSVKESERDRETWGLRGISKGVIYSLTMKFKPSKEGSEDGVRDSERWIM